MFQPGTTELIPVDMVMTMVRNAIEQGMFFLAQADHTGSTIS